MPSSPQRIARRLEDGGDKIGGRRLAVGAGDADHAHAADWGRRGRRPRVRQRQARVGDLRPRPQRCRPARPPGTRLPTAPRSNRLRRRTSCRPRAGREARRTRGPARHVVSRTRCRSPASDAADAGDAVAVAADVSSPRSRSTSRSSGPGHCVLGARGLSHDDTSRVRWQTMPSSTGVPAADPAPQRIRRRPSAALRPNLVSLRIASRALRPRTSGTRAGLFRFDRQRRRRDRDGAAWATPTPARSSARAPAPRD